MVGSTTVRRTAAGRRRSIAGPLAFSLLLSLIAGLLSVGLAAQPAPAASSRVPTHVKVVGHSVSTSSVRLQWDRKGKKVGRIQIQACTSRGFTNVRSSVVKAHRKTSTQRVQAITVRGLRSGTTYFLRARSFAKGHPSRWSRTVKITTRATAPKTPAAITGVSTRPGPGVGEMTVSWRSSRADTDYFRIDTGLTMFGKANTTLPDRGRQAKSFVVPGTRTSVVLTARQLAAAGAPVGSANHLYFRVFAINKAGAKVAERAYPRLQSGSAKTPVPTGRVPIRVGTFNVRTIVKTDTGAKAWTSRAPYVARTIMSRRPGVLALQELSPGGVDGTSTGVRQTDSLMAALSAAGGSYYAMVRNSSYFPGGTVTGSQGARIVYDTRRYTLLSDCTNRTQVGGVTKGYSQSCSFTLPLRRGDSEAFRRSVAYAQFQDRATGSRFWFVSAHLEHRTSKHPAERQRFESLRGAQAAAINARMRALDADGSPIIVAGDLNTWQNTPASYAPHNTLVANGYYDTADAVSRVNIKYATFTDFETTVLPTALDYGARLDTIMATGVTGAARFENVMQPVDHHRASDHNLVVADFRLPS